MSNANIKNGVLSFDDFKLEAEGLQYKRIRRPDYRNDERRRHVIHYPELVNSVDRSVDPCTDFYSFVCNGWIKENPIPEQRFLYTQTEMLDEKITKQMREILMTSAPHPSREHGLMTIFYKKCLYNSLDRKTDGIIKMFQKMRELKKTTSITEWLLIMRSESLFYELTVSADDYNSTINILQIAPSSSMLSAQTYFNPAYSREYAATRTVLFNILALISAEDTHKEFFSANIMDQTRRVESLLRVDQTLAKIDWFHYVTALLPLRLRHTVTTQPFRIVQFRAVQRLEEFMLSIDEQTMLDYLDWKEFQSQLYGVKGRNLTNDCVKLTTETFRDIAGKHYLEQHFDFGSVFAMKELIEDIRSAFMELLVENNWMDESTKKRAREKVRQSAIESDDICIFKLHFTSQNSFYDIVMAINRWGQERTFMRLEQLNSRDVFDTSVVEVNAFYDVNQNQIGASYDKLGNRRNWWNKITYKNFEIKKKCFEKQYGNISVKDVNVKKRILQAIKRFQIDGKRTEGENIADNGGIRAAIRAALRLFERTPEQFTIVGLEDFTPMQYFFMSYAFMWCGSIRTAMLLDILATDVHPPDMYRVNVVLSNQPEFARTFDCKRNSNMNPENTCTLW
ncbi:unnamed protein product [Angiostrongylus costaricensis]|uniref:Peptidase_M13 domain-containing protein n=1 Tax=Angiostrongylus costaricensis TaxID=334426 RepID=A0A158PF92_ANGCS|nr:unnamed protein product [Angiostrongylus costaricensis]